MSDDIHPFRIAIPETDLEDLRQRLALDALAAHAGGRRLRAGRPAG